MAVDIHARLDSLVETVNSLGKRVAARVDANVGDRFGRNSGEENPFKKGDMVRDRYGKVKEVIAVNGSMVITWSEKESGTAGNEYHWRNLSKVGGRSDASPPSGTVVQEVGKDWKIYRTARGTYIAWNATTGDASNPFTDVSKAEGFIRRQSRSDADTRSITHDGRLYVATGKTKGDKIEYEHPANNGKTMTVWLTEKEAKAKA